MFYHDIQKNMYTPPRYKVQIYNNLHFKTDQHLSLFSTQLNNIDELKKAIKFLILVTFAFIVFNINTNSEGRKCFERFLHTSHYFLALYSASSLKKFIEIAQIKLNTYFTSKLYHIRFLLLLLQPAYSLSSFQTYPACV